jgi:hypothetical protein
VSMSITCRTELHLPAMRQITVRRPGMFAAEKVGGLWVVVRFLTSAPVEGAGAEVAGRGFASWVGEAAYPHRGVAYTSAS